MSKLRLDYVRREVWGHNAHLGRVFMAKQAMYAITSSPTATPEARRVADGIAAELHKLYQLLQTRVDPPSAFQVETKTPF